MIAVDEALGIVSEHALRLDEEVVSLSNAIGLVLNEDLSSDLDIPPFTKSMMDGFAISVDENQAGQKSGVSFRRVIGQKTAGDMNSLSIDSESAVEIMTGAALPDGANSIVVKEDVHFSTQSGDERIEFSTIPDIGQNVLEQGTILKTGDSLFRRGDLIRCQQAGLLAEIGCSKIKVIPKPKVAIITTGDELIPVDQLPSGDQIRNSNGPMLEACSNSLASHVSMLGHVSDEPTQLATAAKKGLESDVLILTGGVSAGVKDYVPSTLESVGVRCLFHKVSLKPGKPIWFGVYENAKTGTENTRTLVFGLPGNPVSSFVCFQLFVIPVLLKMAGRVHNDERFQNAALNRELHNRGNRTLFHPGLISFQNSNVDPLAWKGSADQTPFAKCNCLIRVPPNDSCSPGESVKIVKI